MHCARIRLLQPHRQDAHSFVIVLSPDLLLATLRSSSPILEPRWAGLVREVHPVERLPKVWVVLLHALQYGVQLVVALGLGEPPQCLFFGGVVTFAHGLLPSLTIAGKCSLGQGTFPSQRLVCEEHTYQDRHGNDQERDGQVSQSPGPFRASACGQGSERGESEPGHGVQRIAIDDRSDSPDEPQRRGYPHEKSLKRWLPVPLDLPIFSLPCDALEQDKYFTFRALALFIEWPGLLPGRDQWHHGWERSTPKGASQEEETRRSAEITSWPSATSSALKLDGPPAQSRILPRRSPGVRANILTYSSLDRPQGTTCSSLGMDLHFSRSVASALSRRLTLRAALFGWIMPLPAALLYSLWDSSLMRRASASSPDSTAL